MTGPSALSLRTILAALLILTFTGGIWVQRTIDRERGKYGRIQDVLYLPSGEVIRKLCLGYEGLVADIYWTRVVQYYGRRRIDRETSFNLLGPLLDITTTLDPHLLIAYRFGAMFLAQKPPEGPGRPNEALHLIRRGIVANPDYWRLWQDLGFIYYWDLKDYERAAQAFETGSQQPGAQTWMKVLAASVYAQGGNRATSRFLWSEIYRTAENDLIRRNALQHLLALRAEEEMESLQSLLGLFAEREGKVAQSWQELVEKGYLRSVPLDPAGYPYLLPGGNQVRLSPRSPIDLSLLG